jgi:hypothetical protein
MGKEPNGHPEDTLTPEQKKSPTSSDRLVRIMQSITGDFTDEDLDEIINLVEKIKSKKKGER